MVDRIKIIDYVWLQKWDTLTLVELQLEQEKLIDKLNLMPEQSHSFRESITEVLEDLEIYIENRKLNSTK